MLELDVAVFVLWPCTSVGGYRRFGRRRALNFTLSKRNLPQCGKQVGSVNVNIGHQVWRTDTRMFNSLENRRMCTEHQICFILL
jgi:hypothetical protein